MPPEGVVDALRAIHRALVPGGLVIDTQPLSAHAPVETDAGEVGALDMREWVGVVTEVDRRVEGALRDGLFAVEDERRFVVTDAYDDGAELVAVASDWVGTRVPAELAARLSADSTPARLRQDVRLRVLRAGPAHFGSAPET